MFLLTLTGRSENFNLRVIGIRKFSYDLWGDAVNLASRMEAKGSPGKIQVTEAPYRRLQHRYRFEQVAQVQVKGWGEMTTYHYAGQLCRTRLIAPLDIRQSSR